MAKKLTAEEEKARRALVKLAADNGMYFVVWWGHFNNYLVGLRNASKKRPEVYHAMYEMFYDVKGSDDTLLFRCNLGFEDDWPDKRLPWTRMLQIANEEIRQIISRGKSQED